MMITRLPAFLRVNAVAFSDVDHWEKDWPHTDFSKTGVDLGELFSGGIGRDALPAIDTPTVGVLADVGDTHDPRVPVIWVTVNG